MFIVSLSAVTVSTTGMVTESQDTDGMRPAQTAAVIEISALFPSFGCGITGTFQQQ